MNTVAKQATHSNPIHFSNTGNEKVEEVTSPETEDSRGGGGEGLVTQAVLVSAMAAAVVLLLATATVVVQCVMRRGSHHHHHPDFTTPTATTSAGTTANARSVSAASFVVSQQTHGTFAGECKRWSQGDIDAIISIFIFWY